MKAIDKLQSNIELQRLCNVRVKCVTVVMSALGTVPKYLN